MVAKLLYQPDIDDTPETPESPPLVTPTPEVHSAAPGSGQTDARRQSLTQPSVDSRTQTDPLKLECMEAGGDPHVGAPNRWAQRIPAKERRRSRQIQATDVAAGMAELMGMGTLQDIPSTPHSMGLQGQDLLALSRQSSFAAHSFMVDAVIDADAGPLLLDASCSRRGTGLGLKFDKGNRRGSTLSARSGLGRNRSCKLGGDTRGQGPRRRSYRKKQQQDARSLGTSDSQERIAGESDDGMGLRMLELGVTHLSSGSGGDLDALPEEQQAPVTPEDEPEPPAELGEDFYKTLGEAIADSAGFNVSSGSVDDKARRNEERVLLWLADIWGSMADADRWFSSSQAAPGPPSISPTQAEELPPITAEMLRMHDGVCDEEDRDRHNRMQRGLGQQPTPQSYGLQQLGQGYALPAPQQPSPAAMDDLACILGGVRPQMSTPSDDSRGMQLPPPAPPRPRRPSRRS